MVRGGRLGERVTPRVWLAVVAVAFGVVQVLLVRDLPLGWDESIYASQDDPRRPALLFTAPRARGMPWIAAPLQAVTGSTVALRVYLAVLAAVALYLAYAVWLRVRPDGSVPLAALGFGSLWITLFYAPSLMPNVPVALAGVLATGTLLCAALGRGPRWLPWAGGAAVAVATLIRPGDVVPLVGALAAAVVLHPRWRGRALSLLAPPVAGALLGALPWVIEAQQRYDGLFARIRRAISTQSTGQRFVPDYELRALDGPLLCRPCNRATQPIPLTGLMWWVAGAVLVALAVWLVLRAWRDGGGVGAGGRGGAGPSTGVRAVGFRGAPRSATLLPAFVGVVLALPYLFLVGYAAPRFLLPAYALLALPAGQALRHLCLRPTGAVRPMAAGVVAVLLAGHLVVQVRQLTSIVAGSDPGRQHLVALAAGMARHGVAPPCMLIGPNAAPVAYVARCDAVRLKTEPGDEPFTLADLQAETTRQHVALVLTGGQRRPSYAKGWTPLPARDLPHGWRVYVAPGH